MDDCGAGLHTHYSHCKITTERHRIVTACVDYTVNRFHMLFYIQFDVCSYDQVDYRADCQQRQQIMV